MSQELQTLNQRIAERIGKDLVELIPEDQWQALVDKEVEKFQRETAPEIIKELLTEKFKEHAVDRVSELSNTVEWSDITSTYTNEKLRQFIAQSGGEIFAGVLTPAMQMVISDLNQRLNSGY